MSRPLRPGTRQTHRLRAASAVVYDGNVLGGSRCRILHYSGILTPGLLAFVPGAARLRLRGTAEAAVST